MGFNMVFYFLCHAYFNPQKDLLIIFGVIFGNSLLLCV